MTPAPSFRSGQPADAPRLTAIALAAKRHWGYPPEWIEAWRDELTITPAYLAVAPVTVAEVAGELVGFVGLLAGPGGWHLEHLWLEPRLMGRGLGRALFAAGVDQARAVGAKELRIVADPHADGFYLKMGAVRTGTESSLLLDQFRRDLPVLRYTLD